MGSFAVLWFECGSFGQGCAIDRRAYPATLIIAVYRSMQFLPLSKSHASSRRALRMRHLLILCSLAILLFRADNRPLPLRGY